MNRSEDKQCILIVDEDAALRDLVSGYLGSSGYLVTETADGAAMRALLSEHAVERAWLYPYIRFLHAALAAPLALGQLPRLSEDAHEHFQVEFTQGGRRLYFEFSKARITPRPSWALVWIALSGILATLCLAWLLGRRVTAPVARLAEAARRIGTGKQGPLLPEQGDAEFADLAHVFNETSGQLQAQRENQTTLLAGVSHDLRSPLARMKMALGMLAEEYSSPLLLRMDRDIAEMNALIGAQLALARAQEAEKAKKLTLMRCCKI